MSIIRVAKRQSPYVVINKSVLEDERLSFKARGLAAYLLGRPDNWETNERHLEQIGPDGRSSVRSGLKELEDAGYLKRMQIRNKDGTFGWQTEFYEQPWCGFPSTDNPSTVNQHADDKITPEGSEKNVDLPWTEKPTSEKPTSEKPTSDNRTIISNEVISNEVISNEVTKGSSNNGDGGGRGSPSEKEIFHLWHNEMGVLSEISSELLGDLIDEYGPLEVEYAIREAVKSNARNMRYVQTVCKNRKAGYDPRSQNNQKQPRSGGRARSGGRGSLTPERAARLSAEYEGVINS